MRLEGGPAVWHGPEPDVYRPPVVTPDDRPYVWCRWQAGDSAASGTMIRVAVWIDYDTECICAYVLLPGCDLVAAASSFPILAVAVEREVLARLPAFVSAEVGYLHVGCLRQPIDRDWLRQRLEEAV